MAKKEKIDIWDNFNDEGAFEAIIEFLAKGKHWKGNPNMSAKHVLFEYSGRLLNPLPGYMLIREEKQLHGTLFTGAVTLTARSLIKYDIARVTYTGMGDSRQQAELNASEKACDWLGLKYKPSTTNT